MTRATEFIVEKLSGASWVLVYEAACDEVVMNSGAKPSTAKIRLNGLRWNDKGGLSLFDLIRIRTPDYRVIDRTIIFTGVLTSHTPSFSGGNAQGGGDENSLWFAQCPKYVMAKQGFMYGQWVYSKNAFPSATADWASGPPTPDDLTAVLFASGKRCIFNENGNQNKDPNEFTTAANAFDTYIFGYLNAAYWTAKQMIVYCLTIGTNATTQSDYVPSNAPEEAIGLDHADWNTVINHVVVESLNVMEAIEYIASLIGWKYRYDWYYKSDGTIEYVHVFYRPCVASSTERTDDHPTLLHSLYLPDNYGGDTSDSLSTLLSNDKLNLPDSGQMIIDGTNVVNESVALGERTVFEITAELVPAFEDTDIKESNLSWTISATDKLFYSSNEIQDMLDEGTDPDDKTFFKYFHPNGSKYELYKNAGRKWALNEIGEYTRTTYNPYVSTTTYHTGHKISYGGSGWMSKKDDNTGNTPAEDANWTAASGVGDFDRGAPYDFATAIDSLDDDNLSYFLRPPKECLTGDSPGNAIQYRVEWSADGGTTWHSMHEYGVELLTDEWGIYITAPNLSEVLLEKETTEGTNQVFAGSTDDSDGQKINYWTSVFRDVEKGRSFKGDAWETRVRLTASLQMEKRAINTNTITASGASITQTMIYDWSRRFRQRIRESGSVFSGNANYQNLAGDQETTMESHQTVVDYFNKLPLYSGHFNFANIKLAEGSGDWRRMRFMLGDCLSKIDGRGYDLKTLDGLYTNIEQIIYQPELATMTIVTADIRGSRVG